jgi:hypothetical protein
MIMTDAQKWTTIYVVLLMALGVAGFLATGMASITALIPTFFGLVVLALLLALPRLLKPSTVVRVLFAAGLLGLVATIGGVPKVFGWLMGEPLERPAAAMSQTLMAILSAIYAVLLLRAVRSGTGN